MMCGECVLGFFYEPVNIGIVLLSISMAIIALFFVRKKDLPMDKKLALLYAHLFFFVFPFVYYAFFRGCQTIFEACSKIKPVMIMLGTTSVIALIIGLILAPIIFISSYKRRSIKADIRWLKEFIENCSAQLTVKTPQIYIVDFAKPFAFSVSIFSPKIFISIGMMEILTRKEIEAVILHEFSHIKNRSSIFKLSSFYARLISPLARFTTFLDELTKEEQKADTFAIASQNTPRHINSAKKKIYQFHNT